jgi:hypothetical protein
VNDVHGADCPLIESPRLWVRLALDPSSRWTQATPGLARPNRMRDLTAATRLDLPRHIVIIALAFLGVPIIELVIGQTGFGCVFLPLPWSSPLASSFTCPYGSAPDDP